MHMVHNMIVNYGLYKKLDVVVSVHKKYEFTCLSEINSISLFTHIYTHIYTYIHRNLIEQQHSK